MGNRPTRGFGFGVSRAALLDRLELAGAELAFVTLPKVFVGGGTMPLYVDEASGSALRETIDIDVMVEAGSHAEFAMLEAELRARGFRQDIATRGPRCRWFKGNLQFDIVDIRADYPLDQWVRPVGAGIVYQRLPSGLAIPILSPGRFLAAKVAALMDRGGDHWYESADFEDIVLVLESHPQLQPWLIDTPGHAVEAVASWAVAATRRAGIREEIEATVTRGPRLDERVAEVFDRLLWLAFDWGRVAKS